MKCTFCKTDIDQAGAVVGVNADYVNHLYAAVGEDRLRVLRPGLATLLSMRSFPAEVVAEADGRRLGDIVSQRIHRVAEPRFEERVAGL